LRWTAVLGLGFHHAHVVAKTLRRTVLALPGRLTRSARRWMLHLPADWPWAHTFAMALARLRCIPYPNLTAGGTQLGPRSAVHAAASACPSPHRNDHAAAQRPANTPHPSHPTDWPSPTGPLHASRRRHVTGTAPYPQIGGSRLRRSQI
jgi:hypothetical protein